MPSDDEIDKYSEGVQKRINKLKFEAQSKNGKNLKAHRLQEEALRYAQQIKSENEHPCGGKILMRVKKLLLGRLKDVSKLS